MSRERHEEQAALHALGTLAAHDQGAFEAACHRDPELRGLTRDLREVCAQLVHLAPPTPPPPALRHRVLQAAAARRPL